MPAEGMKSHSIIHWVTEHVGVTTAVNIPKPLLKGLNSKRLFILNYTNTAIKICPSDGRM